MKSTKNEKPKPAAVASDATIEQMTQALKSRYVVEFDIRFSERTWVNARLSVSRGPEGSVHTGMFPGTTVAEAVNALCAHLDERFAKDLAVYDTEGKLRALYERTVDGRRWAKQYATALGVEVPK